MIWLQLALFVVSFIVTALLAPKPKLENARASTLDDLQAPTASEGTPVPIVLGKVRLRGPNTLWYGDFVADPVTTRVKTGLFSSKTQTIGFRYSLTFHLGLCLGPGVKLHRIWCDKEEIFSGELAATGEQSETLDLEGLFGGDKSGGGLSGTFRYYGGAFDQVQNALLMDRLDGAQTPAYRGLAHIVFEEFYIGTAAQLRPMSFEVSRYPNSLGLASDRLLIGEDLNAAAALYEILTAQWGGLGASAADLDTTSFTDAAETLFEEGHGISLVISSPNAGKEAAREILRHIDGLMYQDPETSKIKLKLIRQDYVVDDLPLFNEDNVAAVRNFARTSWDETFNQVRVSFTNRTNKYETGMAMVQDLANVTAQGRVRATTVSFPGLTTAALATEAATRELTQLGVPLYKATLELNREAASLRPGDPFVFSWPDYNITSVVMRVQAFDLGELLNGRVVVEAVQDQFATNQVVYAEPAPTGHEPISTSPTAITAATLIEAPYWLVEQTTLDAPDAGDGYGLTMARRPSSTQIGWRSQVSSDNFVAVTVEAAGPYTPWGNTALLEDAIGAYDGFTDGVITVVVNSPLPTDFFADSTEANMADGANLFLIDEELFSFETQVDNLDGTWTLSNVRRALLDTAWAAHSAGAAVYFLSVDGIADDATDATDTHTARFWSQTYKGESSVYSRTRDFDRRYERPLPPDLLTIEGVRDITTIVTEGDFIDLEWRERTRLSATISFEDDATETPEASTTYTLRYYHTGVLQETITGLTGTTYTYEMPVGAGSGDGVLELSAVRDGLESYTACVYPFVVDELVTGPIGEPRYFDTYDSLTMGCVYSVRKRVDTYSGPLVRIRDSITNAEQDVGFDTLTGELGAYTISGGADARVTTWYDQSGNGADLVQATTGRQPLLTTNAAGKNAVSFTGLNKDLTTSLQGNDSSTPRPWLLANPQILMAFDRGSQTAQGYLFGIPNNPAGTYTPQIGVRTQASSSTGMQTMTENVQRALGTTPQTGGTYHLMWGQVVSTDITALINSVVRGTPGAFDGTVNYPNLTNLRLGEFFSATHTANTTNDFGGTISEFVIFAGAADRLYETTIFGELQRNNITTGAAHRYWRIRPQGWQGTFGGFAVYELELRDTLGGANIATGGTILSSGTATGSPANVLDGNTAVGWLSTTTGGALVQYIGYDFGVGNTATIREFKLWNETGASFAARSPANGFVEWSDDNVTWYPEWAFEAYTVPWVQADNKVFTNPNL